MTQDEFDRLLAWLNEDPEEAGTRYEDIRQSLIKIFTWRGCADAEDLADEVFNRVAARLHKMGGDYVGDPAHYCYGVARKMFHECHRRAKARASLDDASGLIGAAPEAALDETELEHECLERCVESLDEESRALVIAYYALEKRDKIEARQALAQQFGISINNLRVRLYRIRARLEKCVRGCLEEGSRSEMN